LADGVSRRDFIKGSVAAGAVVGGGLGAFYIGYGKAVGAPLRVGVIGAGDEGNVLMGAITPDFIQVKSIADIRPYNVWRAFHGDHTSEASLSGRPGLMAKYGWKTEDEARRHVTVYGAYEELIENAKADGIEGVIIALPLHLHAPAAVAAMKSGLHVLTEKLMGHSVHECKEMARVAHETERILATGHQRHYNILYANAMDSIQRGVLGELHYVRAQWNRGNLPGKDSWQQPMPKAAKPHDPQANDLDEKLAAAVRISAWIRAGDPQAKVLEKDLRKWSVTLEQLKREKGKSVAEWEKKVAQVRAQIEDAVVDAKKYGYESKQIKDASGKMLYDRPAIEELIRWRLWDRTGGGLMAELGSHQLDAASIFIHAMHKAHDPNAEKPHPLSVAAAGNRPLFPPDRDCEDHVYCIIEFPAPGYDPKDPFARRKKIGVQYASINGNGFGGYGEIVFGTKGTLILEREQELSILKGSAGPSSVKVSSGAGGPTLDTQASGAAPTRITMSGAGGPALDTQASGPAMRSEVSRGYTEELEHWAWCIRHPSPENQPRCTPKVAMADAVIALTTNIAARKGERVEFKKEWFEIESDETPEDIKPDLKRYK
jgi:predicted dehydrogenase